MLTLLSLSTSSCFAVQDRHSDMTCIGYMVHPDDCVDADCAYRSGVEPNGRKNNADCSAFEFVIPRTPVPR